jgi:hypothetical protein
MKNLSVIQLNNYVRPNPVELLQQTKLQITNGEDNSYFYFLQNVILGSPTLTAVVDAYTNYTVADGLVDIAGGINIEDILSREDLTLIINDFKSTGNCAIQIVYQLGNKDVVAKMYHAPIQSIAVKKQADLMSNPTTFYYSADWRLKSRFKPIEIPAYGTGEGETEILYIKRPSAQPIFSLPDWQSAIQFAVVEEELSNYYSSHIKNGFSAGTIVNINQGATAESDEAQEDARKKIINKLTGTSNAGRVIVSFNDNVENATTVDSIAITDAYQQFEFLTRECREKILLANKVIDPALFGFANSSGFSSTSDQMITSLKMLYRNQIKPMREAITKAITPAFKTISPNVQLEFKDFEELTVNTPQQ